MSTSIRITVEGEEPPANPDEHRHDVAAIRRHIEAKVDGAVLEQHPFPHLIIADFFPDAIYRDILAFNLFRKNPGVEWISRSAMKQLVTPTPYDHRRQINFHKDDPYTASPKERGFWNAITRVFLEGTWFPELVYRKFPAYFDIRFGEATLWPDLWRKLKSELFVQRHEPDYYIGPHTDIPTRIFTCIFSFAEHAGFEEYGTQLLRHRDPLVRCSGRQHYDFIDFHLVKTAPYAPNYFLLFFKTRQSFHAVKTVSPEVPDGRYGMQYQLYEPGIGLFRDLSHPDLLAAKHVKSEK